jgi:hypothetical protein
MLRFGADPASRKGLRAIAAALLASFLLAGPAEALVGGACAHHDIAHGGVTATAVEASDAAAHGRHVGAGTAHHAGHVAQPTLPAASSPAAGHDGAAHPAVTTGAASADHAPAHGEDGECTCLGACVQAGAVLAPSVPPGVEGVLTPAPTVRVLVAQATNVAPAKFLLPWPTAPPLHG